MLEKKVKKVSVIVPAYNVEEYIERCLISLVNQTLNDIEIIVVNDGSTDRSQEIIEEFAKKYPEKIRTYEIPNGGVAKARSLALQKATGEYVGFVDSDDYVDICMYEKLYIKAIEEEADIVSCAYYRKNKTKCIEKESELNIKFGYSVYEVPELFIESVPYIWNKIFKRDLIEKNKISFQNFRIYEDLIFTYELYLNANRISKVFEPLYFYDVTRETSLTYKFTEKRFDIIPAFQHVVNYMKEKNCFEQFSKEILFLLLKHIYVVLQKNVTKDSRKLKRRYINEVFQFLDQNFVDWKQNMYFTKYRENKNHYKYKMYWILRSFFNQNQKKLIKKTLRGLRKTEKLFGFNKFVGNKFLRYMKYKINEKAILINSQQGRNINGNMFYILNELQQNKKYDQYKIYVAYEEGNKKDFRDKCEYYQFENYKLVKVNTNKYAKILATSKYLFNDTSFPTYFIKRKEQVYLNTWHGTPLKTLGKATNLDFYDIANLQKNFVVSDYLLYPSQYMKKYMLRDYMLENIAHNKIMLAGYPRNEIFFNEDKRKKIKEKFEMLHKTTIAYMPTWRGNVRDVSIKQQIDRVKKYLDEIDKSLNESQVMYVNFHPYVGNKINFKRYKNIRCFPKQIETYDFLNACDMLITDYSSVFFDYAITRNKIILFTYDEEEYLAERGMYISLKDLPFAKAYDVKKLIKEINNIKNYDDSDFINTYCQYDRKDISKQICRKIILNERTEIKIENIKKETKSNKNILLYAERLDKNRTTDTLISASENIKNEPYNYYLSYITRAIKPNARQLRTLEQLGMNYMGQLGSYVNSGRINLITFFMVGRFKKLYTLFEKQITCICETEIKRIYGETKFDCTILYGKIGVRKLYELSCMRGKKIIYLTGKSDFNQKVNEKIYEKFDYILVDNEKTLLDVKQYCKNIKEGQVKVIGKVEDLKDFNKYVEEKL